MPAPVRCQFGPFVLDLASFRLLRGTSEVPLTPKAFEILALLVRERHRALTKQELFDAVWPDTAVTENTLTQRIKEIREALGDRAQEPAYVRTVPRVGFQFVADVREADAGEGSPPDVAHPPTVPELPGPGVAMTHVVEHPVELQQDDPATGGAGLTKAAPASRRMRPTAVAVAVIVAMALLVYATRRDTPPPAGRDPKGRVMLAILPFENLSGDPEQAYIADGLTEEMIAELGRLDPARLGVIARTSVMAYQSTTKGVAEIARELSVDFVLEGSIRREADRVRVVAQLIRASDQTHVWAERYDRDLRSILSLQSEVARAIAQQTRMTLSADAEARLGRTASVQPDVYQAYLRGRFFLNQRTGSAVRKAFDEFQRSISLDPSYAPAFAGLAEANDLLVTYADVPPREAYERGMAAAQRALELDPGLAEAYTSLGAIHASYTWNWAEAEQVHRRALQLDPNNALAHKAYADLLSFIGRHDEAVSEARRAVELEPLSLLLQSNLGLVYSRARRGAEAVEHMKQTLAMDPNYMLGHLNLGLVLAGNGSFQEATAAFQRARQYSPEYGDSLGLLAYAYGKAGRLADARSAGRDLQRLSAGRVSPYVHALYHLGLGEREQALAFLESAYEERSWLVALLKVDPLLDDLRAHPRFQALLARMSFPESAIR
jgi:TolB-like protein/DNA-binding winged helix-turn-helix (wHTH) protein/Flp pilus assembly protein TadD